MFPPLRGIHLFRLFRKWRIPSSVQRPRTTGRAGQSRGRNKVGSWGGKERKLIGEPMKKRIVVGIVLLSTVGYGDTGKWNRLYSDTASASSYLQNNWNKYTENYHPNYA